MMSLFVKSETKAFCLISSLLPLVHVQLFLGKNSETMNAPTISYAVSWFKNVQNIKLCNNTRSKNCTWSRRIVRTMVHFPQLPTGGILYANLSLRSTLSILCTSKKLPQVQEWAPICARKLSASLESAQNEHSSGTHTHCLVSATTCSILSAHQ